MLTTLNPPLQTAGALNQLIKSRDVQEILDLGRPIFGNPMILVNMAFSVLAITDEPEIASPNWKQISDMRGVPVNAMVFTKLNSARRESLETGNPVIDGSADDGIKMLRKTLASGNRILGYLDSPMYYGDASENEIAFFDFLGNLLSVQLQRGADLTEIPENMLDYFIFDLLEGKLSSSDLIEERLRYFKWNIMSKGKAQIISIHRKTGEPEMTAIRTADFIKRFTAVSPHFRAFVYDSEIKVICSVRDQIEADRQLMDALKEILKSENLVAGISRQLTDIGSVACYNRQAKKAAELGMMLFPKKNVHLYDSYAIYHALELSAKSENPIQFCHSAVMRLWDYDREHDTDLLESLHVYLANNLSVGKSAAALYIHRNTMNYRISKIIELTKVDLTDTDVLCNILFSFYALQIRQSRTKKK